MCTGACAHVCGVRSWNLRELLLSFFTSGMQPVPTNDYFHDLVYPLFDLRRSVWDRIFQFPWTSPGSGGNSSFRGVLGTGSQCLCNTLPSVDSVEHECHPQEKNPANLWLHSQLKSHVTWLHSSLGTPHCQEQPWQGRPGRNTGCGFFFFLKTVGLTSLLWRWLQKAGAIFGLSTSAVMSWEAKINFSQTWLIQQTTTTTTTTFPPKNSLTTSLGENFLFKRLICLSSLFLIF